MEPGGAPGRGRNGGSSGITGDEQGGRGSAGSRGGPMGSTDAGGGGMPGPPPALRTPEGRERLMRLLWLISLAMLAIGYALIFWIWACGRI
ncbi:MAG: hypothetical protein QXH42_06500 [Thermoplasmata archaeon]